MRESLELALCELLLDRPAARGDGSQGAEDMVVVVNAVYKSVPRAQALLLCIEYRITIALRGTMSSTCHRCVAYWPRNYESGAAFTWSLQTLRHTERQPLPKRARGLAVLHCGSNPWLSAISSNGITQCTNWRSDLRHRLKSSVKIYQSSPSCTANPCTSQHCPSGALLDLEHRLGPRLYLQRL